MSDKDSYSEMFERIRNLPKEDAKELFDTIMAGRMKGAAVAIMARNFSHGIGSTPLKKKYLKRF